MNFLNKKIYTTLLLIIILLNSYEVLARDSKKKYTRENISNYFSGVISTNQAYNDKAFEHLNKVRGLKNYHSNYNVEFLRTLVLLEKFNQAFNFSKKIWTEDELFFEADLLLGLDYFIKKDYINAEKHFERLNIISRNNLIFDNFIGNILIAWSKAAQGNEKESHNFIKKIPRNYNHLKNAQHIFLKCYFDNVDTQKAIQKLVGDKEFNFSRYNFFLINYLLSVNKIEQAKKVIKNSRKKYSSNLLLKQTELFFNKERKKIGKFFNCKNPKDPLGEFFYVIANLYASENEYRLSNMYLKISQFLNKNFLSNETLLAENLYYQEKNNESKKVYYSIKSIGSIYSWHASKNIASILLDEKGVKYAVKILEKDFNLLVDPSYEHYYELANFYKDNEYYKESIKYYSLSLKKIKKDHFLVPKILDRRGTSFERLGDWENAEKDLIKSLEILPDQPQVLNYLAYTWIDKGINLNKGLEMLKKAVKLREEDGYIIDSLGWAYFAKKKYIKAKFFLQRAVELLPYDPVINDHYADSLWMLNKDIQARYIWNNILKIDSTKQELKDDVKKKLIFGIVRKL